MCLEPNKIVVDERSNDHFIMSLRQNGLFSLVVGDQEIIDRGGLHEFIDLRSWKDKVLNGQPFTPSKPSPNIQTRADIYRKSWHYLQYYNKVKIVNRRDGWKINGTLATADGIEGGMRYTTKITIDHSPIIKIDVWRKYIGKWSSVGDDSICFLSPGGFAKRFSVYTASNANEKYWIRDDGKQWSLLINPAEPVERKIPNRLYARVDDRGWGAIFGQSVGFGLIVDSHTGPAMPGQMRCTRPRPPAETKFDEVEFQWGPSGPRIDAVETASFRLIACKEITDIVRIL